MNYLTIYTEGDRIVIQTDRVSVSIEEAKVIHRALKQAIKDAERTKKLNDIINS